MAISLPQRFDIAIFVLKQKSNVYVFSSLAISFLMAARVEFSGLYSGNLTSAEQRPAMLIAYLIGDGLVSLNISFINSNNSI